MHERKDKGKSNDYFSGMPDMDQAAHNILEQVFCNCRKRTPWQTESGTHLVMEQELFAAMCKDHALRRPGKPKLTIAL
jgi:hypothetical protein